MAAPCECTGTQKFVHPECLQRWQSLALRNRLTCPVCQHNYRLEFVLRAGARQPGRFEGAHAFVLRNVHWLGGLLLAALGSLLLPHNALCMGLVLAVILINGLLRYAGVWFAITVDEAGTPSWRLIRHGPPVEGLEQGCLLVASTLIRGGMFVRAVVVLTEHDPVQGSLGYILNQPLGEDDQDEAAILSRQALQLPHRSEVAHGRGGPVAVRDWTAFHSLDGVAGALPLGRGRFLGGEVGEIRRRMREELPAQPAARPGQREAPRGVAERLRVQVLHGHAAWAAGQLEGEIRAGAWLWTAGVAHRFLLDRDPASMWAPTRVCLEAAGQAG